MTMWCRRSCAPSVTPLEKQVQVTPAISAVELPAFAVESLVKDPVEVVRVIDPGALLSSARWQRRFGDPRVHMSDADLRAQFSQAVAIRDEISRLTRDVRELRSIKQQLAARNDLVHGKSAADPWVKGSTDLIAKLDDLESRIHNPKAEVVYDILAF